MRLILFLSFLILLLLLLLRYRLTAFAEAYHDRPPTITVHDWNGRSKRARRVLLGIDYGANIIKGLHFTADNKHLVVLSGEAESTITYVMWEKSRIVAQYRGVGSAVR